MDLSEFEITPLARVRIAEERFLVAASSALLAPNQVKNQAQRSKVSFANKVRGDQPQHLDVEDLPTPEIKGNMPSIKLPKKAVERGRLYCKYCLVGRFDLQKIKLEDIWVEEEEGISFVRDIEVVKMPKLRGHRKSSGSPGNENVECSGGTQETEATKKEVNFVIRDRF
ncbi:hypothetical protein IFM89_023211 [Coptis chinensis]|uniref:Uncharacterized protein n=1 Tax=Coptis chinensis TaxID=261450 RepID=A0A835I3E0_9MAGN|nr:hypothetical protein IFM89_023211 [Coptis chinensis]